MALERELDFLREIFKKCRIGTTLLSSSDGLGSLYGEELYGIIGANADEDATVQNLIGKIEEKTKYKLTNELHLQYFFIKLPTIDDKSLLFIGPFLPFSMKSREILEIGEALGLSPSMQKSLAEYCSGVPIISDDDRIIYSLDVFCERIWNTKYSPTVEIGGKHLLTRSPLDTNSYGNDFDETLKQMEEMEQRYAFENEMLRAVEHGRVHKSEELLGLADARMFESRLQDSLRNAKNYCIIMNTLLRKASERGGVHPLYIDRESSKFAQKIEQLATVERVGELMQEMFSSYCRLVRKHSTKQYSPVVKKTVLMIDSDVSAELSLHILAEKQGVSSPYLATVFKKETKKTVSEYIRDKRIERAKHLLSTTGLQIQSVAMHCGIMDVQYFSKLFKKQTGKTPKEYRSSSR